MYLSLIILLEEYSGKIMCNGDTDDSYTKCSALRTPNNTVDSPTPEVLFLGRKSADNSDCFLFGIWELCAPLSGPNNRHAWKLIETAEPSARQEGV